MNGMRMNQSVAPTSFITSISRRRANIAVRIVFQMSSPDENISAIHRPVVYVLTKPCSLLIRSSCSSASVTLYTAGNVEYFSFRLRRNTTSVPSVGTILNSVGIVSAREQLTRGGVAGEHAVGVVQRALDVAVRVRLDRRCRPAGRAAR